MHCEVCVRVLQSEAAIQVNELESRSEEEATAGPELRFPQEEVYQAIRGRLQERSAPDTSPRTSRSRELQPLDATELNIKYGRG